MLAVYITLGLAVVLLAAYPITKLALNHVEKTLAAEPAAEPGDADELGAPAEPKGPKRDLLLAVKDDKLYAVGKKWLDAVVNSIWWMPIAPAPWDDADTLPPTAEATAVENERPTDEADGEAGE